jgi:uncharacterized protein YndB with AHSA1/START domain
MNIDVAQSAGAVARAVRKATRDGRPARVVVADCSFDTTVEDLWDAITNPERIRRWLIPISGDLRLGQRYQLEGNAGGEIIACDPPKLLTVTWEFGDSISWVAAALATVNRGASLTLEHTAHLDEHWEKFGPSAAGVGWDVWFLALRRHLATGESFTDEQSSEWLLTRAGRDFARLSADGWRRAAVTDGEDPAQAQAAADRTFDFYTEAPSDAT